MDHQANFTNHLAGQKSPYLLQHAHNPVDWYPWGQQALQKAQQENKPLFVSIGYATCHWCHVMEKESFEDPKVGEYLNRHFVSIKVDREEHPQVDHFFMSSLHVMGQQGGWPLNIFATPQGLPFGGGTYYPPEPRWGRPSLLQQAQNVAQGWQERQADIQEVAQRIQEAQQEDRQTLGQKPASPRLDLLELAYRHYEQTYDSTWGGFVSQGPNKFPPSMALMLLLRHQGQAQREQAGALVAHSLERMLLGGIYDCLGGGLSRYSTDHQWKVPHFEKMLYDNALFVLALLEAGQALGRPDFWQAARHCLGYLKRDLADPAGAFYCAEDADSQGEEGKFYVWSQEEFDQVLGPEAPLAAQVWGVSQRGNFEERTNILFQATPPSSWAHQLGISEDAFLARQGQWKERLFLARSQRVRPLRDEKVLLEWNALALMALAKAAWMLPEAGWLAQAQRLAQTLWSRFVTPEGKLLRSWQGGSAHLEAGLADYSLLALGLVELFKADQDPLWLERADWLMQRVNQLFRHPQGAYYNAGLDPQGVIPQENSAYDGVQPAGNSATALALLWLDAYGYGEGAYAQDAKRILWAFDQQMQQAPTSLPFMLQAWLADQLGLAHLELLGHPDDPDFSEILSQLKQGFYPLLAWQIKKQQDPSAPTRARLCQGQTCREEVGTWQELKPMLG